MSLQAWMASSSAPASLEPPEQPTATRATAAAPAMPDMRRRVRGVRMMGSLHFVVQFGGCGGGSTGGVDAGEPGGARRRAPETGPGSAHRVDVFDATSVGRRAHPRNDPRSDNPISRIGNMGYSKAPTCRNGGPAFRVDTGS